MEQDVRTDENYNKMKQENETLQMEQKTHSTTLQWLEEQLECKSGDMEKLEERTQVVLSNTWE